MVSRWLAVAVTLGVSVCASVLPISAETLTLYPPVGFETSAARERSLVDVYLFDRLVAETPVRFDSNTIAFEDAAGLLALLPDIKDPARLEQALGVPLDANADLACASALAEGACGFVHADVIAVIFDVARFRVDLFINPRFTFERDPRFKYLPPPTASPGLLTRMNSRSIYDFDRLTQTGTHNVRAIAGYGRWAGRAELFTDLEETTLLRSVFAERSGRDQALTVGLFPRQTDSSLARTEQLLGLRLATSAKTRLDRSRLGATILDISVTQSAIVEVLRDGDILDVQRVEPEQRELDTSRLPQGTYSVELRIREGGEVRSELRNFSSSGSLPPQDSPQWYVELGQAVPFNTSSLDAISDGTAILAFGRNQRISNVWAARASGAITADTSHSELGVQFAYPSFNGQVSWLASTAQDYGVAIRGQGTIRSWQVNGSYREVVTRQDIDDLRSATYGPFPRDFRQARLSAYRSADWGRYGARAFYRQDSLGNESWFAGSQIDFGILDRNNWRLNLELRGELGSDRDSSFIGVRLLKSLRGRGTNPWRTRLSTSANSILLDTRSPRARTVRRVIDAQFRASRRQTQNRRLSVFGGIRQEDIFGLQAGAEFQTASVSARIDGRRTFQNQNSVSLDLQSGWVLGPNGLSLTSSPEESGVQVAVDGAASDQFVVQVDGLRRGETSKGGSGFAPLAAFDLHDVAIAPLSSSEIEYDQSADRLIAYPGNVIKLRRIVRPIAIFIGRLVDARGNAIINAVLVNDRIVGTTQNEGYFQVDGAAGDVLTARRQDGTDCTFTLPQPLEIDADYVDAGLITCCPTPPMRGAR